MHTASQQRKKVSTAALSVGSNTLLIILKLLAGVLSGSVSIISEAIHSLLDLIAAIIAFFSVKISGLPPDKNHPYGHGKFENVSGVIEALLVFVAAGWIIYEAIKKIIHPEMPDFLVIGIIVMLISSLINFIISRRLYKVAKETDSVAMEADALHLKTDVYTSLGVGVGLLLIWITHISLLDPIIAIIVAAIIIKEAFTLLRKAFRPLLDVHLPDDEIKTIKDAIDKHLGENMSYHMLRTRKAGFMRYVDLHLEVPGDLSVTISHDLCDKIEAEIKNALPHIEVSIHIEPAKETSINEV